MAKVLKSLFEKLPDFVQKDWPHLMRGKRSFFGILVIFALVGFSIGWAWAIHLYHNTDFWRLSNYSLKQKTIEFSSALQVVAVDKMLTDALVTGRKRSTAAMKFRALYAKDFRATALKLRETLQSRVCGDYKSRRDKLTLSIEYEVGDAPLEVATDLESMANDLCWYRAIIPRLESAIAP